MNVNNGKVVLVVAREITDEEAFVFLEERRCSPRPSASSLRKEE